MDKYAVDIDKVLDAFERSEALEENQSYNKTVNASIESNQFLNFNKSNEKLNEEQPHLDKHLSGFSSSFLSAQNTPSKSCELPNLSMSSVKEWNLFEADFSPTVEPQNAQSFHDSNTVNHDNCYNSFHHSIKPSEDNQLSSSNLTSSPSSCTTSSEQYLKSQKENKLSNNRNPKNLKEILCDSVKTTEPSISEFSHYTSFHVNVSSLKPAKLINISSETDVSNNLQSEKCTNAVSVNKEAVKSSFSENQSSALLPSINDGHSNKTGIKTESPNFINKEHMQIFPSILVENNVSHLQESNSISNKERVCFSNIDESTLNFDDMNDYLNDITTRDLVLDEDSGVSSQEDLNGNNLSIDISGKEKHTGKRNSLLALDYHWSNSSPHKTEKCSDTKLPHYEAEAEQNSKCVLSSESVSTEEDNISSMQKEGPENQSCEEKINLCKKTAFDCETGISSGAIPKRDTIFYSNFDNSSSSKLSTDNANKLCDIGADSITSNNTKINLKKDLVDDNNVESIEVADENVPHDDHLLVELDNKSQNLVDDNIVKKLENTDDSSAMIVDLQTHLQEVDYENDSPVTKHLTQSKLQRPTSLHLPFCNVATSVSNSSFCSIAEPTINDTSDCSEKINFADTLLEHRNSPDGSSENISTLQDMDSIPQIGSTKPFWIPDSEAACCMHCNIKFTVIKRRHHCRACGKVLCSSCCSQKARLPYLSNKENRVCLQCFDLLTASQADKTNGLNCESPISSSCGSSPSFSPAQINSNFPQKSYWRPHPNNPDDYCSTISPLQQVQHLINRPPPTVMVPVGVLKRGSKPRGEPKQVIFSDGIRPGGDLSDLTESVETSIPANRQTGRRRIDKSSDYYEPTSVSHDPMSLPVISKKLTNCKHKHKRMVVSDAEGPLPPILLMNDQLDMKYDFNILMERLKGTQYEPVVFAITKNLHVLTKITKLECYFGKDCWCFTSHGLCTVGQDEILFILERFPDEDVIPRDAFTLFSKLYDNACKGSTVSELGHLVFPENIFGNWEHRGFLFIRPTFQILNQLVLPNTPFLVAILIQKWEVPWAKVFPLRLMLRLGEECRHYPCSLVSVRRRKPVYYKIGETIMSVLSDLRNYQFTIPFIPGLVVHIEEKKTYVNIPRNRYEKLIKVLNSNNVEHVLALGANFSMEADSHLVCMQTEKGDYVTQAMSIKNTVRKVTGASFIVFSGALKSSDGFSAKFSIVEDGLLIQILQETMDLLHSALREMRDLTINCGPINSPDPEVITIQWTSDDKKFNIGVISPVDGRVMDGIPSLRIHSSTDYASENYLIRWTEVFFLELDENANRRIDAIDPCRLAETVAQSFCMALIPFLNNFADDEMTRIGLRVILDTEGDKVEYEVGVKGQPLPSIYMNALDSSLIPVISRVTSAPHNEPIALELIFHIVMK